MENHRFTSTILFVVVILSILLIGVLVYQWHTSKVEFVGIEERVVELEKVIQVNDIGFPIFSIPTEEITLSKWEGKKTLTLGTSISWQDGKEYNNPDYSDNKGQIARGYQTYLREELGLIIDNQGVSGARIVGEGGTLEIGKSLNYQGIDLVILEIGTNDFKLNTPVGEIGGRNLDTTTFYGAYRQLIEYILTENPDIRVVLLTPLQRDNAGYSVDSINTSGHKLSDYVAVIKGLGVMYSLLVCDLYSNSGISVLTLDNYTMDGLHPHDKGYERMGSYIVKFLEGVNP